MKEKSDNKPVVAISNPELRPFFRIIDIDNGACRVVYSTHNEAGQEVIYCLQDEGENYGGVLMYRCTPDWHEPSHTVKPKDNSFWRQLQIPTGSSDIEKVVRKFLVGKTIEAA